MGSTAYHEVACVHSDARRPANTQKTDPETTSSRARPSHLSTEDSVLHPHASSRAGLCSTRRRGFVERAPSTRRASTMPASARIATKTTGDSEERGIAVLPANQMLEGCLAAQTIHSAPRQVENVRLGAIDSSAALLGATAVATLRLQADDRLAEEGTDATDESNEEDLEVAQPSEALESTSSPPFQGALDQVRSSFTQMSQRFWFTPAADEESTAGAPAAVPHLDAAEAPSELEEQLASSMEARETLTEPSAFLVTVPRGRPRISDEVSVLNA